jgi:hypothetical protein
MTKPDDFITGQLPPEDADAVSYAFVKALMAKASNFSTLLKALDAGANIDQALTRAYGASASKLATQWATSVKSKRK